MQNELPAVENIQKSSRIRKRISQKCEPILFNYEDQVYNEIYELHNNEIDNKSPAENTTKIQFYEKDLNLDPENAEYTFRSAINLTQENFVSFPFTYPSFSWTEHLHLQNKYLKASLKFLTIL